MIGTLYQ